MTGPAFDLSQMHDHVRQQLDLLRVAPGRMHHVVDLEQARVLSSSASRPPTPAMRAQRFARLGLAVDVSVFGGPSYRLTARHPFQETPLAHLTASNPSGYLADVDEIAWFQPRDPGDRRGFMQFHFAISPDQMSVASISVSTFPWASMTGHLTLRNPQSANSVSIPITQNVNHHTFEIAFVPLGGRETDVIMVLEPGIQVLVFHAAAFHEQEPLIFA